jgi:hypothetical protein
MESRKTEPVLVGNSEGQTIAKLAVLYLMLAIVPAIAQTASKADSREAPIRVEVSQPVQPHTDWENWLALIGNIAWPTVVTVGLFLFRKPLSNFLDMIGKRATEISFGGLGIKLPTLAAAPLGEEVLTFRAADAFLMLSSSAKSSLINMFEQPGKYEFVAINLGRGEKWLSSRLYIFAIMLQRMKALRCIVFLSAGADTDSQFFAATTPDRVRWSLARAQPWLETAYANALVMTATAFGGQLLVLDQNGAIDAAAAEQLVKNFITNLTVPPAGAPISEFEWVTFASNQPPEHATWLSREYLQSMADYVLWKDSIVASETKKEARSLVRCSAPYVARVKKNGEFIDLIDRVTFLDEMITKVSDLLVTKDEAAPLT